MPAILFDLDGVVIDSERLQHQAYSMTLARFGVRITHDEFGMQWTGAGRGAEYAIERYQLPFSAAELRAVKSALYHDLVAVELQPMPGAVAALERLAPHFPLALATNSTRADVDFVMQRLPLEHYFKAIVTREDYRDAKPAPDAFETAAARLGVDPAQCVVIEDAYKGVVAARRAGCRVVAIPNEYTSHNDFSAAHMRLASPDELTVERIEELFRGPLSS
jgi:HAD superfamily hydrolase (TIGR01509 family)